MSNGHLPRHSADLLAVDARNRALRVFLVGLALDVATAVLLVLVEVTASGEQVDWRLLPALLAKTAAGSAGAYVLRRYGDPSSLPTPLPPSPPGEPARSPAPG